MFFCLRNLYKGVSDRKIVIGFLLCCILYFLINALYLVKYGARYTSYYPIIVLIYAIFLIGFIFFKHHCCPEKFYHKVSCTTEPVSGTLTGTVG